MNLLASALSSISVKSRVKYISLSLIGVSAVAGITNEELSGGKISELISQLGKLIPLESLSGGGRRLVQA